MGTGRFGTDGEEAVAPEEARAAASSDSICMLVLISYRGVWDPYVMMSNCGDWIETPAVVVSKTCS